jgi:hypothetical protein
MRDGVSIAVEISGPFVAFPRVARHGPMLKLQWAWFGLYIINYSFMRMLNDLVAIDHDATPSSANADPK